MKKSYFIILSFLIIALFMGINGTIITQTSNRILTDTTVTDYDGNIYHTVTIGTQVWLRENLKSLHYSDGTAITGVMSYNNSDSLANIYGRLYTWNAAMRNSTQQGVQGVCPVGFHVPTDSEWTVLGNFLGGNSLAGGKLKEADTVHWYSPNTGASNTTGFTALGGGEWESGAFQFIKMFGVFWSSTQTSSTQAIYRYLSYNNGTLSPYTWNKTLAYSVRCIKDTSHIIIIKNGQEGVIDSYELKQNYPNPFNPNTKITFSIPKNSFVSLKVYDILGKEVATLVNGKLTPGIYEVPFSINQFPGNQLVSGIYFYKMETKDFNKVMKMVLLK